MYRDLSGRAVVVCCIVVGVHFWRREATTCTVRLGTAR
jgi:hypothetical protein